ncbi:MAG: hypothetical protein GTO04_18945 [Planctomycetales bacterium]|nr:hypothetical protein [Planctomycetales bacterium]
MSSRGAWPLAEQLWTDAVREISLAATTIVGEQPFYQAVVKPGRLYPGSRALRLHFFFPNTPGRPKGLLYEAVTASPGGTAFA